MLRVLARDFSLNFFPYHFCCNSVSFCLASLMYFTSNIGWGVVNVCMIRKDSWGRYVMFLYVLYIPVYLLAIVLYIIHNKRVHTSGVSIWHCVYLLFLVATTTPLVLVTISENFRNSWVEYLSITLKSSQCFIMCMLRLLECTFKSHFSWFRPRKSSLQELFIPKLEIQLTPRPSYDSSKNFDVRQLTITLLGLHYIYNQPENSLRPGQSPVYEDSTLWNITKTDLLNDGASGDLVNCKRYSDVFDRIQVMEYSPMTFTHLKGIDGWNNNDICASLSPANNKTAHSLSSPEENVVWFTYDKRFMLKVLTEAEKEYFLYTFLPRYHYHLAFKSKNMSLLARILGFFTICGPEECHILIIENIVPDIETTAMFEFKGRLRDRQKLSDPTVTDVKQLSGETLYLDLDFLQTQQSLYLELSDSYWLKTILTDDVEFLESMDIEEYTLFLVIGNSCIANRHELIPRFARHSYVGKASDHSKLYVLGIFNYLQGSSRDNSREEPGTYSSNFLSSILGLIKSVSL